MFVFLFIIICIAMIVASRYFAEVMLTKQQKKLTKKQIKEMQKMIPIVGWLIALYPIIAIVIGNIISIIIGSINSGAPLDVILCFIDRHNLRVQGILKKKPIAWGWCLLSPVYLYKRTKLLKESMLKFWILAVQYIIIILAILAVTVSASIQNNQVSQDSCIKKWTEYAGLERHKAEQICECSAFEEESVCLDKYGILIND